MMERLVSRAAALAEAERRRAVQRVAERLAARFGAAGVETIESGVAVRGRGLNRRWIGDPEVRFLELGK